MHIMMASFHQAKPLDPHSVVVVKKPATTTVTTATRAIAPSIKETIPIVKASKKQKKKVKPPNGMLSVEVSLGRSTLID